MKIKFSCLTFFTFPSNAHPHVKDCTISVCYVLVFCFFIVKLNKYSFNRGLFSTTLRMGSTTSSNNRPRIMVTGGCGQVGVALVEQLREEFGRDVRITDLCEC